MLAILSGQSLLESRLGPIGEGLLGLSQPVVMVWTDGLLQEPKRRTASESLVLAVVKT